MFYRFVNKQLLFKIQTGPSKNTVLAFYHTLKEVPEMNNFWRGLTEKGDEQKVFCSKQI